MLEATRLTRAGQLNEATALLMRGLQSGATPAAESTTPMPRASRIIDVDPGTGEVIELAGAPPHVAKAPFIPGALRGFLDQARRQGAAQHEAPPDGTRFVTQTYASPGGSRDYKLYIPRSVGDGPALIVMLHGCTQSPDDFAAGTAMNRLAERHGCLVAYPAQTRAANAQKCWNWFQPGDQARDQGEPALIAGITRQVMREHSVDARRVFIAGLSAGGATAAIMGQAYPELYAAVGVHSGLACGAARDVPSAFAAMRQGSVGAPRGARGATPTIVFHGDRDSTVHPSNGDRVMTQSGREGLTVEIERGRVPGGHAWTRTTHSDAAGWPVLEQWMVHGGGHAWSGGSTAGSYTDPLGPDASAEMMRFFLAHPRRA